MNSNCTSLKLLILLVVVKHVVLVELMWQNFGAGRESEKRVRLTELLILIVFFFLQNFGVGRGAGRRACGI